MRAELPVGWSVEEVTEGARRIIPGARGPRSSGLLFTAAGLVCCAAGGLLFVSLSGGGGGWRGLRLTMLMPFGLFLIGWGLWRALGREEWRVESDRLEIRQTLLGFRRMRRFQGATLRLILAGGGGATRWQRDLLRASRNGAGPARAGGGWWGLYVKDGRGTRCLGSSSRGFSGKEEIQRLGELLSEWTGWPLVVAPSRRKR